MESVQSKQKELQDKEVGLLGRESEIETREGLLSQAAKEMIGRTQALDARDDTIQAQERALKQQLEKLEAGISLYLLLNK